MLGMPVAVSEQVTTAAVDSLSAPNESDGAECLSVDVDILSQSWFRHCSSRWSSLCCCRLFWPLVRNVMMEQGKL